jgi:hypothetical protein
MGSQHVEEYWKTTRKRGDPMPSKIPEGERDDVRQKRQTEQDLPVFSMIFFRG